MQATPLVLGGSPLRIPSIHDARPSSGREALSQAVLQVGGDLSEYLEPSAHLPSRVRLPTIYR